MDDWERHMTPLLQDMGCGDDGHEDFFGQQDVSVHGGQTSPGGGSPGGSGSGAAGGALSPGGSLASAATPAPACCESGRPVATDPVTGQPICSCQYDARLALSAGYPRLSAPGVYGTPYPSTDQNPYPSIGVDSSAFYSPLSNPYALKEGGSAGDMSAWTSAGLQPSTGYYPYDPTFAAYGYGAGYDLAARRKNATRESTATLKAWLNEHKKNPYPTKGEKIMLAIITKMTLTQVSTWFANARRRLKKENKMTWEPKNKTDDDDDAMLSDDEKDKDDLIDEKLKHKDEERKEEANMVAHHALLGYGGIKDELKMGSAGECGVPIPATKPKIWSLADTAACKTPPPAAPAWPAPAAHASAYAPSVHAHAHAHTHGHHSHAHAAADGFVSPASAPYVRYGGGAYGGGGYGGGACAYPDVQTDTPPQTPPNMKLPSVTQGAAAYCAFPRHRQSPQREVAYSAAPHAAAHHHADDAAFKPFYKSTQQLNNGYVSPV